MRKIVRKVGNSVGITFNKEEQATHNIEPGDTIRITIKKIKNARKKRV